MDGPFAPSSPHILVKERKSQVFDHRYDLSMENVLKIRKMEGKGEITNLMGEKRERGNKN